MRSQLLATIALAAFAATGALAQINHHQYDGGRYGYVPDNRYNAPNPVARALRDLQMIDGRAYVDHHEREHFRHAISQLSEFDFRWQRGHFDRHLLDRAMDNMSHLVRADQMNPRERAILRDDLFALQGLRNYSGRRW